ncbi:hypothetical protein BKA70DRAFT_1438757 [Coprinopsis sp. MPI-PUGE-AT-0042]|nr:hypothetical protein BKA70DRAFT_1438757 [Coprinopsis sp. MPI-PUGE-AT-0042]
MALNYDPLQQLLETVRSATRPSANQGPGEGSGIMSDIIGLDIKDFHRLLLITALRVADCLICLAFFLPEMSAKEKATYKELYHQELGVVLWLYGLYTAQNPEPTAEAQELAIIMKALTSLAAKRSWSSQAIRGALHFIEPDALLLATSPYPKVLHSLMWWRQPAKGYNPSSPALAFSSWRIWSDHVDNVNRQNRLRAAGEDREPVES